jgi:nucleotide-binding universal stress UspA family protein
MFRRILVATDFTEGAAAALDRALRLPLADDARVELIHVAPDGGDPAELDALGRALDAELARARAAAGHGAGALGARCLHGKPFVEIIRAARALDAELIVLGVHGARPVRDLFVGSTAARVVRNGDRPVLLVRSPASAPYRDVLVAVALGDADRPLLHAALQMGASSPAVVHAVHVPFEGFQATTGAARAELRAAYCAEASAKVRALVAELEQGEPWSVTVNAGDTRGVILEEAVRRGCDLLIAGTHARSGIAHALLGSVAETLIASAPCDVLVARPTGFTFELP